MPKVVRPGKVVARRREYCLQGLLDRLLCVEANDGIGRAAIGSQLRYGIGILPGLAQKELSFFELRR